MKVSEAKTKVCPFIQSAETLNSIFGEDVFSFNRDIPVNINCICSGCMAWQYTKEVSDETIKLAQEYASVSHDAFDNRTYQEKYEYIIRTSNKAETLPENEKEGYCKRIEND